MKQSMYEKVTARILELLESGVIPWHKPWNNATGAPKNLVSGKSYRGINHLLLGAAQYESPYWLTYRQAKNLGGNVRKGEKGYPCAFWKWINSKSKENTSDTDTDNASDKSFAFARYYTVFHVTQCEGVEYPAAETVKIHDFEKIKACERIIDNMPLDRCNILFGGDLPYYNATKDHIKMPPVDTFETPEHYYATLFHEVIHSTGHAKRLNRKGTTSQHSKQSAAFVKEELIAEIGSAFLCGQAHIEKPIIENTAAYIQNWMTRLRSDSTLIVKAAGKAQRAADYVLGTTFEHAGENEKVT